MMLLKRINPYLKKIRKSLMCSKADKLIYVSNYTLVKTTKPCEVCTKLTSFVVFRVGINSHSLCLPNSMDVNEDKEEWPRTLNWDQC